MEVRKKLNPGDHGTKRHVNEHGDKLVCVRYRYDDAKRTRYTTVELIVDQQHYYHSTQKKQTTPKKIKPTKNTLVKLKVAFNDHETRTLVKNAGGIWDPVKKHWNLEKHKVTRHGLEKRIIKDAWIWQFISIYGILCLIIGIIPGIRNSG